MAYALDLAKLGWLQLLTNVHPPVAYKQFCSGQTSENLYLHYHLLESAKAPGWMQKFGAIISREVQKHLAECRSLVQSSSKKCKSTWLNAEVWWNHLQRSAKAPGWMQKLGVIIFIGVQKHLAECKSLVQSSSEKCKSIWQNTNTTIPTIPSPGSVSNF